MFAAVLPGTVTYAAPADDDITCEGPEPDESSATGTPGSRAGGAWTPAKWPTGIPNAGDARDMLGQLLVERGRVVAKYDRTAFRVGGGTGCWIRQARPGEDCCSTREIVLKEQSTVPVRLSGKCRVIAGRWTSEYDLPGKKEIAKPGQLDIDHIVPLKEAWDSGASTWDVAKREKFANDISPDTPQLIAVSGSTNRSKGDKRPDQWMPPDPAAACPYTEAWIAVKHKYDLSVTQDEGNALAKSLRVDCGG
ncbi:HNH endonuclease family protein [Streptomyces sp. NPDC002537]